MNVTCYAGTTRVFVSWRCFVDDFVPLTVRATPSDESLEQAMYPVSPALGGMQPMAVTYPGTVVNTVGEAQGMPIQVTDCVENPM